MYVYKNNCNCLPIVKSQSVAISDDGSALLITLPSQMTLLNGKAWKLVICQNLPDTVASRTLPVLFVVNGITYGSLCYLGNTLRKDMLSSRKCYVLQYAWDTPHFIITSKNLKESVYIPTTNSNVAITNSKSK